MIIDCNKIDERSQTRIKLTGHTLPNTQASFSLRPQYPPTYTLPIEQPLVLTQTEMLRWDPY